MVVGVSIPWWSGGLSDVWLVDVGPPTFKEYLCVKFDFIVPRSYFIPSMLCIAAVIGMKIFAVCYAYFLWAIVSIHYVILCKLSSNLSKAWNKI